jgi:hypothetical protein
MREHMQDHSLCVDHQMVFPAGDPLATIIPRTPPASLVRAV